MDLACLRCVLFMGLLHYFHNCSTISLLFGIIFRLDINLGNNGLLHDSRGVPQKQGMRHKPCVGTTLRDVVSVGRHEERKGQSKGRRASTRMHYRLAHHHDWVLLGWDTVRSVTSVTVAAVDAMFSAKSEHHLLLKPSLHPAPAHWSLRQCSGYSASNPTKK